MMEALLPCFEKIWQSSLVDLTSISDKNSRSQCLSSYVPLLSLRGLCRCSKSRIWLFSKAGGALGCNSWAETRLFLAQQGGSANQSCSPWEQGHPASLGWAVASIQPWSWRIWPPSLEEEKGLSCKFFELPLLGKRSCNRGALAVPCILGIPSDQPGYKPQHSIEAALVPWSAVLSAHWAGVKSGWWKVSWTCPWCVLRTGVKVAVWDHCPLAWSLSDE